MSFIETTFLNDLTICDKLIAYFLENSSRHSHPVHFLNGKSVEAAPEYKQSTDLAVVNDNMLECPAISDYLDELDIATTNYVSKWPSCNAYAPWSITTAFNIQYYKPGEGFHSWHTERCSANEIATTRHLVFMTYLNTVSDGGGTEFLNQNITINAEKGKTLIWPADWTHTHKGIVSPTEDKFIITGWFNYTTEDSK